MVVFATPNWAAGHAMQRLLIITAVVMAISAVGIFLGARLVRRGSTTMGWLVLLVGCLIPVVCYFARPQVVPLENGTHPLGSDPSNKITEGMARDEVRTILGPPHQRNRANDRETWIYWSNSFAGNRFDVEFGPDGRVTRTHGN